MMFIALHLLVEIKLQVEAEIKPKIWNVDNGNCLNTIEGHTQLELAIVFSRNRIRKVTVFKCPFRVPVHI